MIEVNWFSHNYWWLLRVRFALRQIKRYHPIPCNRIIANNLTISVSMSAFGAKRMHSKSMPTASASKVNMQTGFNLN